MIRQVIQKELLNSSHKQPKSSGDKAALDDSYFSPLVFRIISLFLGASRMLVMTICVEMQYMLM